MSFAFFNSELPKLHGHKTQMHALVDFEHINVLLTADISPEAAMEANEEGNRIRWVPVGQA